MTSARFKDLCLDATDPALVAAFWSAALLAQPADGPHDVTRPLRLDPASPHGVPLWINPVPEPPPAVKARVHLDLRLPVADPGELLSRGATVVRPPNDQDRWWSLADPEGNEFCAFPPRDGQPVPPDHVYELVVDARDGDAQADWWASVLGGTVHREDSYSYLTDVPGFPWENWVFQTVPEPRTVKNRLHWDVALDAAGPEALLAAGATLQRAPDKDISWWILTDPEGNEFCTFPPE